MNRIHRKTVYPGRRILLLLGMVLAAAALVWRAVCLQVLDKDFLLTQGEARHLRVVTLPAHRGMIQDRNGEPLAISTPVESVWVNPQELGNEQQRIPEMARLLSLNKSSVQRLLASHADREFIYLRRHIDPATAAQVEALAIPGVYLQREYRRYYPAGEVTAHVVGFTNVDDVGQEGLELAYENWLRGEPGAKRVIKDGKQSHYRGRREHQPAAPGQGPAAEYRPAYPVSCLPRAARGDAGEQGARAASAVVLDVKSRRGAGDGQPALVQSEQPPEPAAAATCATAR